MRLIYLRQGAPHLERRCGGTPGSMRCLGVRHPLLKYLEVLPVLCSKPCSNFLASLCFLENCQYQTGTYCGLNSIRRHCTRLHDLPHISPHVGCRSAAIARTLVIASLFEDLRPGRPPSTLLPMLSPSIMYAMHAQSTRTRRLTVSQHGAAAFKGRLRSRLLQGAATMLRAQPLGALPAGRPRLQRCHASPSERTTHWHCQEGQRTRQCMSAGQLLLAQPRLIRKEMQAFCHCESDWWLWSPPVTADLLARGLPCRGCCLWRQTPRRRGPPPGAACTQPYRERWLQQLPQDTFAGGSHPCEGKDLCRCWQSWT